VYIKFRIYEGDPVRLARLDVLGLDSILDVPRLKRDLPLQVGDPFNRALFQASADTVSTGSRTSGTPMPTSSATMMWTWRRSGPWRHSSASRAAHAGGAGADHRRGEGRHRDGTRMLSVRAGDWFRQDQLYLTQRDLYGLGMFRSVNVVLADTTRRGVIRRCA